MATLSDLGVLDRGRDRLLSVAEVAERLALLSRFWEESELTQLRINNSIRVRPLDAEAFIAALKTGRKAKTSERHKKGGTNY